jgi:hypothetical protein
VPNHFSEEKAIKLWKLKLHLAKSFEDCMAIGSLPNKEIFSLSFRSYRRGMGGTCFGRARLPIFFAPFQHRPSTYF